MYADVWIVGGGASGLAAAVTAARQRKKTGVLEHKEQPGKKLLATGNGKCNYTNERQDADCYRSDNAAFPAKVLNNWSVGDTLDFFSSLGIEPKIKKGYVYPRSEQASCVVALLRLEAERLGVTFLCSSHVSGIQKKPEGFELSVESLAGGKKPELHRGRAVILCTGGQASAALGSDGSGYGLAGNFGHHIRPAVPALIGLKAGGSFFKRVSGIRAQAGVSLHIDGTFCAKEEGELQLAAYGISGIPVFQVSRYAAKALREGKEVEAFIDFFTEATEEGMYLLLKKRSLAGWKTAGEMLLGLFNQKLGEALLLESGIAPSKPAGAVTEQKLLRLARSAKGLRARITDTNGFEQAQATAGGIDTTEVEEATMESKKVKGLYFAGELLDVDGCCGGYNLHWAWATGVLAGKNA